MAADVHAGRIDVGRTDSFFRPHFDADWNASGANLNLISLLSSRTRQPLVTLTVKMIEYNEKVAIT
jgi:hypothetical protein